MAVIFSLAQFNSIQLTSHFNINGRSRNKTTQAQTQLVVLCAHQISSTQFHSIQLILHYITLHYITLHYITLHYITLHYITLHTLTEGVGIKRHKLKHKLAVLCVHQISSVQFNLHTSSTSTKYKSGSNITTKTQAQLLTRGVVCLLCTQHYTVFCKNT